MKTIILFITVILLSGCTILYPEQADEAKVPEVTPSVDYADPTRPPYDTISEFKNNDEGFDIEFSYSDEESKLYYYGKISTPTPCYQIKVDSVIAESFPEQVTLKVDSSENLPEGQLCVQSISQQTFSGSLSVSKEAKVTVFVNGKQTSTN